MKKKSQTRDTHDLNASLLILICANIDASSSLRHTTSLHCKYTMFPPQYASWFISEDESSQSTQEDDNLYYQTPLRPHNIPHVSHTTHSDPASGYSRSPDLDFRVSLPLDDEYHTYCSHNSPDSAFSAPGSPVSYLHSCMLSYSAFLTFMVLFTCCGHDTDWICRVAIAVLLVIHRKSRALDTLGSALEKINQCPKLPD